MTLPTEAINEVADLLYRKGTLCDFGVDESVLPDMIELALARYPNKRAVRAIRQWVWWDLDVSEENRCKFVEAGVQPAMIFATYLLWDNSKQFEEGWNVKTTPLVTFEENCFFITRNTVYILVGQEHRKTVKPQTAASVYF